MLLNIFVLLLWRRNKSDGGNHLLLFRYLLQEHGHRLTVLVEQGAESLEFLADSYHGIGTTATIRWMLGSRSALVPNVMTNDTYPLFI